ncbi:phosphoglycolate phosphatase-like HAD superfamily hydrolase [Nakamurella sp. UYEF19]|uniref:HAD family hydrolase n=1 Tax=Nakamurella sp. UYEF19 TaxID=1756392 RepID=UPI00339AE14A
MTDSPPSGPGPMPTGMPDGGTGVTAVLWDIDGTLLSSGRVAVTAFLDAVQDIAGRRPEGRGLDLGGRIDPEIAGSLLGSIDADHTLIPQVLARLDQLATARAADFDEHVRPLPAVRDLLDLLETAGVRQTVVTGNIETVGMLKLLAGGLVPPIDPAVGGFGDHGATRLEVAEASVRKLTASGWEFSPDQCWIVGDTPRDLLCARALGVRCALVGTGRHSVESMAGLGADVLLTGLDQADELLRWWKLTPGR